MTFLRTRGGLVDQGGELRHMGYDRVAALLASPEWKSLDSEDKQKAVSDEMSAARKIARALLREDDIPPPPPGFTVQQ